MQQEWMVTFNEGKSWNVIGNIRKLNLGRVHIPVAPWKSFHLIKILVAWSSQTKHIDAILILVGSQSHKINFPTENQ